jgi:hypothetical protein
MIDLFILARIDCLVGLRSKEVLELLGVLKCFGKDSGRHLLGYLPSRLRFLFSHLIKKENNVQKVLITLSFNDFL